MSKIGFIVLAVIAVGLGLLVGTLNAEPVTLDLLWIQLTWPLGLLVLFALATGLVAGLLLSWLFQVVPLKVRLRKQGNVARPESDQSMVGHDG